MNTFKHASKSWPHEPKETTDIISLEISIQKQIYRATKSNQWWQKSLINVTIPFGIKSLNTTHQYNLTMVTNPYINRKRAGTCNIPSPEKGKH